MSIGKQARRKRYVHGEIFKDVCPIQKRLRERQSRLGKKHEIHFVHVLPSSHLL